jgi:hypothetical protein
MKIKYNDKDHHSSASIKAPIIENPTNSLPIAIKNGKKNIKN